MSEINWMSEAGLYVDITGACMNKLKVNLETGQNPRVNVELCVKPFLEILNKADLNRLKILIDRRLKCLKG